MKKTASRLLALALTASLVLSGCSSSGGTQEQTGSESETGSTTETTESTESSETEETAQTEHEPITDLVLAKVSSSELATFNLLNSETSADTQYLTNIWDGLLEVNNYGRAGSLHRRGVEHRGRRSDLDLQPARQRDMGRCQWKRDGSGYRSGLFNRNGVGAQLL